MLCPRCKSHLAEKVFRSCDVYCCMECDGIWVSKETFCKLGNLLSMDLPEEEYHKGKLFKPRDVKRTQEPALVRICPQCEVGMRQFNYAYDSNIFLDKCPQCGGIWADAGEMMQVAKHLKPDMDERIIGGFLAENPHLSQFERDAERAEQALNTVLCVIRFMA
jgi:Zn-finger nucleic acid-binding protein